MSRASQKRKRKALQRAQPSQTQVQQVTGVSSFNQAAQVLMAQMKAQAKGYNGVLYGPGLPLSPQPGVTPEHAPRQWSYPLVYNTGGVDRTRGIPDIPSFAQLRMLAKMYSGITLPERVWLDMIPGLKLDITLRPDLKESGMNDTDPDIAKAITKYKTFLEKPDKQRDLHSWLRMAIRSTTQIDELYIYKRRTRKGDLYALELVDGSTMKPFLDDWGRIPEPPNYAFQQFPWGLPGDWFTTDDVIHYQETPQDDSPFGFSRVERFMMEVNQALRKKKRDLAMFTEGNVPAGIMEVPAEMNWTADEIDKYEKLWNSLIAGNEQQQVRVKFTQAGMKYINTDKGEILTDFDLFLYKIAFGIYGVPLTYAGFIEDVHKSSDEGQQNVIYNRTLKPTVVVYGYILTQVLCDEFHDDRFIVGFTGYEEVEDISVQATAYSTFVSCGAITPASVARIMKFPDDIPETGPFVLSKDPPVFLDDYARGSDLRTKQVASQVAGLDFATSNPGGAQPPQESEDGNDSSAQPSKEDKAGTGQKSKNAQSASGGKAQEDGESSKSEGKGETSGKGKAAQNNGSGNASKANNTKAANLKRAVDIGQTNTGIMIAFMLDPAIAKQLAIPGGEDPSDMHVTLAYLGKVDDDPPVGKLSPAQNPDALFTVLKAFTHSCEPLQGNVGGLGRFTPSDSSNGLSPVIAMVNIPGLQDFRRRMVEVIELAGYSVANDFDYTPHITLSYVDANAPMPVDHIENMPLRFDMMCLAIGDEQCYFPIGENDVRSQSTEDETSRQQSSKRAIRAEYNRWCGRALSDISRGRGMRPFESDIISIYERNIITSALERCQSVDEVRAVFKAAREGDTSFLELVRASDPGGLPVKSRIDWRNAPLT